MWYMQYLGGKSRIAKQIAQVIYSTSQNGVYVEPFLGAGSVAEVLVPGYSRSILADSMPDLMMMWQEAVDGWVPPTVMTEQEWRRLWHSEPSALRAFAGFPCSFGGKWFDGYARDPKGGANYAARASRSIVRRAKIFRNAELRLSDYRALDFPKSDAVVYCDPPYVGVKKYRAVDNFDTDAFWAEMDRWVDRGAEVYVSEYQAPAGWEPIWEGNPVSSIAGHGADRRVREFLFAKGVTDD